MTTGETHALTHTDWWSAVRAAAARLQLGWPRPLPSARPEAWPRLTSLCGLCRQLSPFVLLVVTLSNAVSCSI